MKKTTLALTVLLTLGAAGLAADKPNLLLLTADDLNGDPMGWMGSKVGATPNLDAFAATCHQFRNCHVSAPICQPSREAFMTGRVPHRNGGLGFNPIRPDVPTMTEVMGSNGWFTAAINKTVHMLPREKFNWNLALAGSGKNPKAMRAQLEQCLKAATVGLPPERDCISTAADDRREHLSQTTPSPPLPFSPCPVSSSHWAVR